MTRRGALVVRPRASAVLVDHRHLRSLVAMVDGLPAELAAHRSATDVGTEEADPFDLDVVEQLAEAGVLVDWAAPPVDEPDAATRPLGLRRTANGIEIDIVDRAARATAHLARPLVRIAPVVPFTITAAALGVALWLVHAQQSGASSEDLIAQRGALATFVVLAVGRSIATIAHELAHAAVAAAGGARIGSLGLGLYWGGVSFYVDSTDAFTLPRRTRVLQAAAGPISDGVLTLVLVICAQMVPGESALCWRLAASTSMSIMINLVPLLQLDGYWIVSDALDDPELHERSQEALTGAIRTRRWPSTERRLVAYGAASLLFGVTVLMLSATLWWGLTSDLVAGLWDGPALSKVLGAWVGITGALGIGAAIVGALGPTVRALRNQPAA